MSDQTELFKQFPDNESSRKWLGNTIFAAFLYGKRKGAPPKCEKCGALKVWTSDPEQLPSDQDPVIKSMFDRLQDDREMDLPRVWAVYPKGKAPADWVARDELASEISQRMSRNGRCIIPAEWAAKAQSRAIRGLVMECTMGEEGSPGTSIGWLSHALIEGRDRVEYSMNLGIRREGFGRNRMAV